MRPILLFVCCLAGLASSGCEADLPPNPNQPAVAFKNDQFRDEGMERPANLATDQERTPW